MKSNAFLRRLIGLAWLPFLLLLSFKFIILATARKLLRNLVELSWIHPW
jgi:hypothetical protein